LKRLFPLFRLLLPYRGRIAVAFVAILLSAAMVLAIGQGLKLVIDEGFARGQERLLDQTLATLAALIALLGVLTWIRVYNVYWIGARFTADLRRRVYDHLLKLSPGFYEEARTGEVASRVTNDVTLIEAVMGGTLLYALRMALTMAGCVAMLFFTSVKLTGLALLCMPLVLLPIGLLGSRVRRLSRFVQDRVADVSSHVDETLHEIRTVQAFAHEDRESLTFGERVEAVFAA
jgi:ATP-binding cassette subfamily B protein